MKHAKLLTLGLGILALSSFSGHAFADEKSGEGKGMHDGKRAGMFEHLDANGDDAISEAEFLNAHKEKFTKMDLNNDGSVSKDEAEKMREQWMAKRDEMRQKHEKRMKDKDAKQSETKSEGDDSSASKDGQE